MTRHCASGTGGDSKQTFSRNGSRSSWPCCTSWTRSLRSVRTRQIIQNNLGLFRGLEDTAQYRILYQRDWHAYLSARHGVMPEVRFYLDETGNEGDKAYTGVGGICVMNWKQFEIHAAALSQWRREQKWPETIHFAETGSERIDRAVRLLGELQQRRSGLLFLGYALSGRVHTGRVVCPLLATAGGLVATVEGIRISERTPFTSGDKRSRPGIRRHLPGEVQQAPSRADSIGVS